MHREIVLVVHLQECDKFEEWREILCVQQTQFPALGQPRAVGCTIQTEGRLWGCSAPHIHMHGEKQERRRVTPLQDNPRLTLHSQTRGLF